MTNEERAQKWLERLWGKDISMPEPTALSLVVEFAAIEKPLEERIVKLEAELTELDGVLNASTDRVHALLDVLERANELARFVRENPPTFPTGNYGYHMVDARYQALVDDYQSAFNKVK